MKKKFGGEGLSNQLAIQAEQKGRLQQVVCSRDGDESGGLELEETKER